MLKHRRNIGQIITLLVALVVMAGCASPTIEPTPTDQPVAMADTATPEPPTPTLTTTPSPVPTITQTEVGQPFPVASYTPATTPIEPGLVPITRNADWSPVERVFNGTTMVLVPAGCFLMGEDGVAGEQCFDETFWIGRFEVTNAEYAEFINADGYGTPVYWTEAGWQVRRSNNWTQPLYWTDTRFNTPTQPVVGVSWYEAMAYATWRQMTLPSERQWEYAARGPDGRIYPWGDDFDGTLLNYCDVNCGFDGRDINQDDGHQYAAPVGSYPSGVSWVGAMDMSGNVWNWTISEPHGFPYDAVDETETIDSDSRRVLRGGSWGLSADYASATYRGTDRPERRDAGTGFRLSLLPDTGGN